MSSTPQENLRQLKDLLDSGEFHHATYRDIGTLWEGLHFYRRAPSGHRGFEYAGCINAKRDASVMDEAQKLVKGTGVSVGSYGKG